MSAEGLAAATTKMREGGVHSSAIDVFRHYYRQLESGATGVVAESDISPLVAPQRLEDLDLDVELGRRALDSTVVIKLNGGLGTSMGMEKAKTLLTAREGHTFLDIIVRQVVRARRAHGARLPLVFMNSFRTSDDTLKALEPYPELAVEGLPLDFRQNREPKLRADDLMPVEWPDDPSLEWCPPGHGDLYTALVASGMLDRLVDMGVRYGFVSNADNLRATADLKVAGWIAATGTPFVSEVCRRTAADRKGGHLAIRDKDGQLVLRESAQTAAEDEAAFADIERHRYFNTNNLWLDLRVLADKLRAGDGFLDLPLIRNEKTVDPAEPTSPKVIQIETAMGAAVEVFPGALALQVERDRFLPVKSTNDLLVLRSDVYELTSGYELALANPSSPAPYVDLDSAYYKLMADFERRFPAGPPSLKDAASLRVHGDWTFEKGVVVRGDVEVEAAGSPGAIAEGSVLSGES